MFSTLWGRHSCLPRPSCAAGVTEETSDTPFGGLCASTALLGTPSQSAEKMAGKNACPTMLRIAGRSTSGSELKYLTVRQLAEQVELLQP